MRNALARTLYELARDDARIVVLVADISPAGAMDEMRRELPHRFINVGVAESAMIGLAAGLAMRGMRPFCYTIATFALFRPYEFIRCDLAYQNLPVTVVGMGAGLAYSTLGGTHQAIDDVAAALAIPGMTVLTPSDPDEVAALTRMRAVRGGGPAYMRIGKAGEPALPCVDEAEDATGARVRHRAGHAWKVVLSYGPIASEALEAARRIGADMMTLPGVRPISDALVRRLRVYVSIIVVEEASGGPLAAELRARDLIVRSIALPRAFPHMHGSRVELLDHFGLTAEKIVAQLS